MKKKVKKMLALMVSAVMVVGLAGCGNSGKTTESEKTSTIQTTSEQGTKDYAGRTMSIGVWGGNEQEVAALDRMIENFEAQTGAKVEKKTYTDYNTQIQADFIAGTEPDTFYIDGSMFPFYGELGVMEPLDAKEMGAENYYKNLLDAFTRKDGTIYCIPKDVSTLATYYNTDLLESVGVKPDDIPASLEEYKDFLIDLQTKLDEKYGVGQIAAMTYNQDLARNIYLLEADNLSITDEKGNAQLSQDGIVENLQFMIDIVGAGVWKTPKDLGLGWNGEAFGVGKTAIMEEGNWVYRTLQKDYDVKFGVKDMPSYKGKERSMAFTVGWGISTNSKEKELAKEWIRYATGKDGMTIWCSGAGCLPSRADVAKEMDVESDPVWKIHSDMTAIAMPWQKGTTINIINSNYQNFVPAAFKGEVSAKEAMEQVDAQANSEIANAQ